MMNDERRARMEHIKREQMSREHGYHEMAAGKEPYEDESPKDESAQKKAFNSKEGYC